jgi:hypothetical protein
MKKGKKGISDSALAKITGTGLIISGLGGLFALNEVNKRDAELSALADKASPAQIEEIKESSRDADSGLSAVVVGNSMSMAAAGFSLGRWARKTKKEEPEKLR